jgi:hypothetical protein
MKIPTLTCTGVSTAISFHLRVLGENGEHRGGWAIVTINDTTHELAIQSDWGSWSYRWSGSGMPRMGKEPDSRRSTLSEFMQEPREELNYFADKLWPGGGYGGQRFDGELTLAALRTAIAERRLEDGRAWLGAARTYGTDAADRYRRQDYRTRFSRESARELWDALEEHALDDPAIPEAVFWERMWGVPNIGDLGDRAWDCSRTDTDPAYTILRESILPAFVDALRARASDTKPAIDAGSGPRPG